jgi:archaea-specific DNA-binding protein
MEDDNRIFIGNKPFMNYVTGVIMQFTSQNAKEVVIKSRGKFISRAVDVAEVTVNKFLKDKIEIAKVDINSEDFVNKLGKEVRVSTIDITLKLKD